MKLLLHICCAPCSVMCIRRLREAGQEVTGFWYNPNIHPYTEYKSRRDALTNYAESIELPMVWRDEYGLKPFVRMVADQLEERKREDDRLNELALTLLEGMLFGFYDNRKENKNWSSMVHARRIPLFIRDAYRIAELMVARSGEMASETNEAPNDESAEPRPATEDPE